jgi:GT2 family glycosyltransferase
MVDIIVLVHNEPLITEKCFKKLFEHTNPKDIRVIVVDNGADVETKKAAKKYLREQDVYVQMLSNYGFAKGVNRGLEEVKSKYFCLLNNDVLVSPDWLKKMKAKLDKVPKAGAVGAISNFASGKQLLVPEDRGLKITDANYEQFVPTLDPLLILDDDGKVDKVDAKRNEIYWEAPVLAFFAVLFKSEVLKKVGNLDEQFSPAYYEDWDYSFRLTNEGYELLVDRETFVFHYGEVTANKIIAETGSNKHAIYETSRQKLIDKWTQKFVDSQFPTDRDFRRLDPDSVTIVIPNTGNVSHMFLFDAINLIKPPNSVLLDITRTVIHFARNEAAKIALLNNTNYIFYLDSDTKFPPDLLVRLLSHRKDLIGAVVTKRVPPYNPCVYKGRKQMQKVDKLGWTWLSKVGAGIEEIDGIGMASTLISMKVFKKMKQPWFFFPLDIGEDLSFCERTQKEGFKLYCDTDLALLHEGEIKHYGWKDHTEWAKQHGGTVIEADSPEEADKKVKQFEKERAKKNKVKRGGK